MTAWLEMLGLPQHIGLWLGALLLGALILYQLLRRKPAAFPYERQPALFTPAEVRFFRHLQQALPSRYRAFGKVRIADVLRTREGLSKSERWAAFNKISAKHLDFVICDAQSLALLGAIELDDSSHLLPHRIARDQFVDGALAAARLPILHVPVRRSYVIAELRQQLQETLGLDMHGKI